MWWLLAVAMAAPPPDEGFQWARETVPALASYAEAPAAPDFRGWGRRVVLYAWDLGETQPACARFVLRNGGEALVTRDGATRLGRELVHAGQIVGAFGAIDGDVVRYDAIRVRATIVCVETEHHTRCLDGSEQVCVTCDGYDVQLESLSPRHGFGYAGGGGLATGPHPQACTGCPPDPGRDLLEPLNDAVRDRTFWTRVDAAPAFFRDRAACEADRVYWVDVVGL